MNLDLTDEVMLLRAQVDYLLERLADTPALGQRPVHWAALDPDQAAQEWPLLTGWVDWLRERYQLHEAIPACWYAHGPLVEELSALRNSWTAAYLDPSAHAADGSNWHDTLDRTLHRLRQWDRTGCADSTHRADLPSPHDTDLAHRQANIDADLTARSTHPEEHAA